MWIIAINHSKDGKYLYTLDMGEKSPGIDFIDEDLLVPEEEK